MAAPTAEAVSVIIPTYNSAAILPDAVDSVLCQTQPPAEIVIVDDGSCDETPIVCAAYAGRARYLRQENAGASAARNTGIAASTGDWLAFLDADDLWEPHKLERQLEALAQNPEADFAVGAANAWSPRRRSYVRAFWDGPLDPAVMRGQLLVRNILTGLCSSIVIRREAMEAVGGFASGKACEDRRLAIALLERHRGLLLPEALVRQRSGPAHWTDPERHRREMLSFIDDHAALYVELDPTGRLRRRAVARMHERTGMHYLENGDGKTAARELFRSARLWPFQPNPWRVMINACLGRLKRPESPAAPAM